MTQLYSNNGRRRTLRTCEQCGNPFLTYSWEVKKGRGRFCSPKCWENFRRQTVAEKFWNRVVVGKNDDDCWAWTGNTDEDGYGVIWHEGHSLRAHRVSIEIANGPFDPKLKGCHTCDNPPCCNPKHLFVGTTLDNNRDRNAKGRQTRGELYPGHRLTETDVIAIRIACAAGNRTHVEIAAEYGVGKSIISLIARGENWSHVGGPITRRYHKKTHIVTSPSESVI